MKLSSTAIETLTLCGLAAVLLVATLGIKPSTTLAGTQAATYVVTWYTANVNNDCVATGGFGSWPNNNKSTNGTQTFNPINPTGSYMFTMRCTGASGSNYDGQPITANAPLTITTSSVRVAMSPTGGPNPLYVEPVLTFKSDRTMVNSTYKTFNLTWDYSDLEGTCTASGDWSGTKAASGRETRSRNAPLEEEVLRTYRISCSAPGKPTKIGEVSVTHVGAITPTCPTCVIN